MTTRKKRLGRGLEALLGSGPSTASTEIQQTDSSSSVASNIGSVPKAPSETKDFRATVPFPASERVSTQAPINTNSEQKGSVANGTLQSLNESVMQSEKRPAPSKTLPSAPVPAAKSGQENISDMVRLNVFDIEENPFQPRREFGQPEIASLAESLKEHDMLQPVLVRKIGKKFQLISGERRLRAAIQAGWKTIPARIREADDRLVAELAIVENLQRKDLNPLEKALSFKRYLKEHGARQEDLSTRLKIDRSTVANLMRLLELPSSVQDQLRKTAITAGHARALLPLGEENEQVDFCNKIIKDGWSVRETERQVSEHLAKDDPMANSSKKKKINPQIESLEKQARMSLGTKVEIKASAKGSGKMVVHFKNQKEFQRIFEQVCREHGALTRAA